jgi:hypothetical protein
MEGVRIRLNDPDLFDGLCRGKDSLPSGDDFTLVTKDIGTDQGNPVALLAFTVQLPDGSLKIAQYTLTGRLFAQMAVAMRGRYGPGGDELTLRVDGSGK